MAQKADGAIDASQTLGKFGSVLEAAISLNGNDQPVKEGSSQVQNQLKAIKEILSFLQMDSSKADENNSPLPEDLSVNPGSSALSELISSLLKDSSEDEAETITKLLGGKAASLKEDSKDNSGNSNEDNSFAGNILQLLTLVQDLSKLKPEDWKKIDLKGAAEVLKAAKIQVLITPYQDMTHKDAELSHQLKSFLEKISGTLQNIAENETLPKGKSFSSTLLTAVDNKENKSLDILKSAYSRIIGDSNTLTGKNEKTGMQEKSGDADMQPRTINSLHLQITKLEQFVLKTEKNGQPVNQEQFIKAFETILSKAQLTGPGGMQKLLIKLNPENLGSLKIEIMQKDSVMTAKIVATTAKAKDMLETQLQSVKQALSSQNLQLEKIEISQTAGSFSQERFFSRNGDNPGHQERQKQEQIKEDADENRDRDPFSDRFAEVLLNMKV
ncbi:Flagellar hook-length control protein FliK [Bacillus sp. OV322]|nr:Flagellar hook-length control protein FliK [Bacillus sp. OV322]